MKGKMDMSRVSGHSFAIFNESAIFRDTVLWNFYLIYITASLADYAYHSLKNLLTLGCAVGLRIR